MRYPWMVYAICEWSTVTRVTNRLPKEMAVQEADDYNDLISQTPYLSVMHTAIAVPLPWIGE